MMPYGKELRPSDSHSFTMKFMTGPTWKKIRKAMQMFLTKEACMRHLPIERAEAIQLLYDTLKQPEVTF